MSDWYEENILCFIIGNSADESFVVGGHFAEAQNETNISNLINSDPCCEKQTLCLDLKKPRIS